MNLTSTPPLLLPISDDNKNHILNNQMGRVAECQILPLLRKFRYPKLMCITQCWVLPHICHSQLPWQLYKRQRPNREISGQFWKAKFKNLTLPPVPPELTPAHQLNTSILFSFHSSMAEILQLNLWPLLPESDQGVCINFTSILFSFSFTMGEIWQPLAASAQIWPISLHLFNTSIIFSFNSTMDEIWHLWLLLPKSDQCLLCMQQRHKHLKSNEVQIQSGFSREGIKLLFLTPYWHLMVKNELPTSNCILIRFTNFHLSLPLWI